MVAKGASPRLLGMVEMDPDLAVPPAAGALQVGIRPAPCTTSTSWLRTSVLDRPALTGPARALGGELYREVEIEAEIARTNSARSGGGRVLSFEPVDSTDARGVGQVVRAIRGRLG